MSDPSTATITLGELVAMLFGGPGLLLAGQIAWHKLSKAEEIGKKDERMDQHSKDIQNLRCTISKPNGTLNLITVEECERRRHDTINHINQLEEKVINRINVFEDNMNKRMDTLEERQQSTEDYIMNRSK